MSAPLSRLAGMFGTEPFTTHEALRQLDARLGQQPALLAFGAQLREAVGRPVPYGVRTIALRRLGVKNSGARVWQFAVVDPDADIL
ncbi:MAG: hypothetical protein ABI640_21960 [Gammaproteobacteria bacterium]